MPRKSFSRSPGAGRSGSPPRAALRGGRQANGHRTSPGDTCRHPRLSELIARSARGLSVEEYRPEQVDGALRGAFGIDSQLIDDETYFVAEENGELAGCGGWSFRSTLFGGDARSDRDASLLDPSTQAAKIRAFFVEPSKARRGVGSALLERCESGGARPRLRARRTDGYPSGLETVCSPRLRRRRDGAVRSGRRREHRICSHAQGFEMTQPIPATLIPGDGIGPEIVDSVLAAPRCARRAVPMGRPSRRTGGRQDRGRPASAANDREHPPDTPRAEGAARDPLRRAAIDRPTSGCARNSSCTRTFAPPAP